MREPFYYGCHFLYLLCRAAGALWLAGAVSGPRYGRRAENLIEGAAAVVLAALGVCHIYPSGLLLTGTDTFLNRQPQGMVRASVFAVLWIVLDYFERLAGRTAPGQFLAAWGFLALGSLIALLAGSLYLTRQRIVWERDRQRMQMETAQAGYRQIRQAWQAREILIHDIRNHLRTARGIAAREEAAGTMEYLDSLAGEIAAGSRFVQTRHEALDLVLNGKLAEAQDKGIRLETSCDDMTGLRLDAAEICSLFANILDNAIEANEKREDKASRWLHLSCERRGELLLVNLSNPTEEQTEGREQAEGKTGERFFAGREKGLFFAAKKGKDGEVHGLGLKSVQRVADAHQGYMDIRAEGGVFSLTLYLNGFGQEPDGRTD